MRVTSTMTNSRYMGNTQQATSMRDYYFQRVLTGEKFSKASEDPVGAARAFRLRSQMSMNSDYLRAANDMDSRLKTSESAVTSLGERISSILQTDINGALNGTNDKFSRETYAKNIRATMSALVTSMNTSDGEQYLFGGAEYNSPPFTVKEGQLFYRGVNVDTGETNAFVQVGESRLRFSDDATSDAVLAAGYKISFGKATGAPGINVDSSNKTITISMKEGSTGEDLQALLKKQGYDAASGIDFSKITVDGNLTDKPPLDGSYKRLENHVDLDSLANETYFIDLGLGMRFDENGRIDPQSVFDASQPGLKYIGFGTNKITITPPKTFDRSQITVTKNDGSTSAKAQFSLDFTDANLSKMKYGDTIQINGTTLTVSRDATAGAGTFKIGNTDKETLENIKAALDAVPSGKNYGSAAADAAHTEGSWSVDATGSKLTWTQDTAAVQSVTDANALGSYVSGAKAADFGKAVPEIDAAFDGSTGTKTAIHIDFNKTGVNLNNVNAGDTMKIGDQTFTFVSGTANPAKGEISIGTTENMVKEMASALKTEVNGKPGAWTEANGKLTWTSTDDGLVAADSTFATKATTALTPAAVPVQPDAPSTGTETELPNNIYSILNNIANIFEDESLSLAEQVSKADPFIEQLTKSSESLTMNITDFGNKTTLVNYVIDRSEEAEISLKAQRESIEKVDDYEAIIDMSQGNLLYQTILRSGSSLIQPTIWDFMK